MKWFSRDYVLRVAAFLLALSASVSIFIHLYGLISASLLPLGLGVAQHYNALVNEWNADSFDGTLLYSFVSFMARVFNLELLTALKLIPTFLLSAIPLLAYLTSLTVTGSRLVGVVAAWMLAFMPIVTTSFMVGNYGLILGLFLFTTFLSFLVRYLKSRSRVALALAISVGAFTLPLSFLLILGNSIGMQGQLFRVNLDIWVENLWLTSFMVVGAAIGIHTLLKKDKAMALLAFVMVSFALAFIPTLSSLHVLSMPILALLVASPLLLLRESCLVHEVDAAGHSPLMEVVIDLPKLFAILLVALLTVATVIVGYSASMSIHKEYSSSRYFTDEEVTSAAEWIDGNVQRESTLSSRPVVAAWLEALSGREFIGSGGLEEALVSETVDSTSFRIQTPSLLVDEWEPFSVSKAPRISYYDGSGYEPIFFVDDYFVKVRLVKENEEWVENPNGEGYRGHQWLSDTHPEVILVQHFETHRLLFEKTIRVSTSEPSLRVEYRVDPKADVKLVGLEFPVCIEPWKEERILETTSDETTLIIDEKDAKISFLGNIIGSQVEESEGYKIVKAEFAPTSSFLEAGVHISINSIERSGMPIWLAYTPKLIKDNNIEYLVTEANKMGFIERSLVDPRKSLIIKDSFNRVLFNTSGTSRVEALISSKVAFDEVSPNGVRLIGYETAGLLINKTLTESDRSIEVQYTVAPKEDTSRLIGMNLTVWIPWDVLPDYVFEGNLVKLNLGFGDLEIKFTGNLLRVDMGPDPEYGQNRVQAVFRLRSEFDEVVMSISSLKPLFFKYEATTRPIMEADDHLSVFMDPNMFKILFKKATLAVCQTNS